MSESDEDVELEHSPLFKYMKEYGLKNDEEYSEKPTKPYWRRLTWSRLDAKAGPLKRLFGHLRQLCIRAFGVSAAKPDVNTIEYYLKEHLKIILNCNGLVEEDASFLANVIDDDEILMNRAELNEQSFFSYCCRFGIPLAILCSYIFFKLHSSQENTMASTLFSLLSNVNGLALLISSVSYLIVSIVNELISWKRNSELKASLECLKRFVQSCEMSLKYLKQSLRFVQEFDIIGRGLLLVVPGSAIARLENSHLFPQSSYLPSSCQCLPLRKCTFRVARKQIQAVRIATRELIKSNPLRPEIDRRTHYVAFIAEDEFGPLVTTLLEDDDNLAALTCHFSVSAIKSICQLYNVQLSEFLRRLALCFHPQFSIGSNAAKEVPTAVQSKLSSLCERIDRNSFELQKSYELTQRFIKSCQQPNAKLETPEKSFDLRTALITAVRSLDLHLKVSIARINDVAGELDKCEYTQLSSQLELLNRDLQACTSCYEECCIRLRKLLNKEESTGAVSTGLMESGNVTVASKNPLVPVISELERLDYAQEDQIFEAYSEETDLYSEDPDDQAEIGIRMKTKEEKVASKNLFKELKSVLVSKAEEWKEREAKAGGIKLPENADESPMEQSAVTDDEDSDGGEVATLDQRYRLPFEEQAAATSFTTHIARMAAARSKMLNLDTVMKAETFTTNEECFGDTSSDDNDSQ